MVRFESCIGDGGKFEINWGWGWDWGNEEYCGGKFGSKGWKNCSCGTCCCGCDCDCCCC